MLTLYNTGIVCKEKGNYATESYNLKRKQREKQFPKNHSLALYGFFFLQ